MKWRWAIVLFLILALLPLLADDVDAACDFDGICEVGEVNQFPECFDCTSAFCGDGTCDPALENISTCVQDCGIEDGVACSLDGQCKSGFCNCVTPGAKGFCGEQPPSNFCCSNSDCDPDYNTTWSNNVCSGGNVKHSRNQIDNYCSNQACQSTTTPETQTVSTCTNGCDALTTTCIKCTPNAYGSCDVAAQQIYWYDSCNVKGIIEGDCSIPTTSGFGTNYCKNGDVFRNKTKTYYACATGDTSCSFSRSEELEFIVSTCQFGCDAPTAACINGCHSNSECTGGNECQVATCNLQTGACTYPAGQEGITCNSGAGTCQAGQCIPITCVDTDNDGYCASVDCNDGNAAIHPGASEVCGDNIDQDCSGSDLLCAGCEGSLSGSHRAFSCGTGACSRTITQTCNNGLWGPNTCTPGKGSAEICGNNVDEDCDGNLDNGFVMNQYPDNDGDRDGDENSASSCFPLTGKYSVNNNDCNDGNAAIHPGATEVCDGIDNNCNGFEDEQSLSYQLTPGVCKGSVNNICYQGTQTYVCDGVNEWLPYDCEIDLNLNITTYYLDKDGDGYGVTAENSCEPTLLSSYSEKGGDCNDLPEIGVNIHPGATEVCDGRDNNCNLADDSVCVGRYCSNDFTHSYECKQSPSAEIEGWIVEVCQQRKTLTQTFYTPLSCTDTCIYEGQEFVNETDVLENLTDGTDCNGGYCGGGECKPVCPTDNTPGCRATTNIGYETREEYGCPENNVCYKCTNNLIWDGTECKNQGYYIDVPSSLEIKKGSSFTIVPLLRKDLSQERVTGWFEYSNGDIGNLGSTIVGTDVGKQSLLITAYDTNNLGNKLATTEIDIYTICTSNDLCCNVGDSTFTEGLSCVTTGGDGVCTSSGICDITAPRTFENSQSACSDGFDNDQDGLVDCQIGRDGQVQTSCEMFCDVFCPAPTIACGAECADLSNNHDNCGTCNNDCGRQDICIAGSCVFQGTECFVGCTDDSQCGESSCVNPGTCEAFCEEEPTLILEEVEQQQLLSLVARQKTYEITKTIDGDQLRIEVTNLVSTPLEEFVLTITIPQLLAQGDLGSDYPYDLLHDTTDKVVRAIIPELTSKKIITFYLPEQGDTALLQQVIIDASHNSIDITQASGLDNDELAITRTFTETTDGTTVSLKLKPGLNLKDVRIPLEIPKCLANSMKEISFDQDNYVIVNDDPLMVWTFDALNTEKEISFTIPTTVDDTCKNQLRAFGLAGDKRKPINPWMPLAIIPIIGLLLVFFQRFHEGGAQTHLGKKEFYKLGREQGTSEHELERAWHEYKRRF